MSSRTKTLPALMKRKKNVVTFTSICDQSKENSFDWDGFHAPSEQICCSDVKSSRETFFGRKPLTSFVVNGLKLAELLLLTVQRVHGLIGPSITRKHTQTSSEPSGPVCVCDL